MKTLLSICLLVCVHFVISRDFYIGMFRPNDFLVAQDTIYKEASHSGYTYASYGRLFKCLITYFRVVDRLGVGRGPITSVVRGGLRKKYIAVRIKSSLHLPISVNVYVGCENKVPRTIKRMTRATTVTAGTKAPEDGSKDGGTNDTGEVGNSSTAADGEVKKEDNETETQAPDTEPPPPA